MEGSTTLARALSKLGFTSRSNAIIYIRGKNVSVNGKIVDDPLLRIDLDKDIIEIDRVQLFKPAAEVIMLHKPRGYVTTSSDELSRKTVYDLIPKERRLFAVGRLDMDTSGLLLFTNDGTLQDKIMSPKNKIAKTYLVTVNGKITEDQTLKLLSGVEIEDGVICKADECVITRKEPSETQVQIKIHEGKNREIRKMLEAVGKKVAKLHRMAIGSLNLDIPEGAWRKLSDEEVERIFN